LMAKIAIDCRQISGIGLTSQRNTVIPMDKDGNALRAAILWLDQRTVAHVPPLGKVSKLAIKPAGPTEALLYAQKNSKFQWIKQHEPDIYRKTHKFVQATSFFVRQLTGEFRDSYGMISGIYPFDYKALRLYGMSMNFIYGALGIEKRHCVDLYSPDKVLGYITQEATLATGLPVGLFFSVSTISGTPINA
ncbi:MAG: FGGY family carbohydrate kinase, partial [Bacteroidota bacterium]